MTVKDLIRILLDYPGGAKVAVVFRADLTILAGDGLAYNVTIPILEEE